MSTAPRSDAAVPFTSEQTELRWRWLTLLDLDAHGLAKKQPISRWTPTGTASNTKPRETDPEAGVASQSSAAAASPKDDAGDEDGWQVATSSRRRRRQGASTLDISGGELMESQRDSTVSVTAQHPPQASMKSATNPTGNSRTPAAASASAFALLSELGSKEVDEADIGHIAKAASRSEAARSKVGNGGPATTQSAGTGDVAPFSADGIKLPSTSRTGTAVTSAAKAVRQKNSGGFRDPLSLAPHPDESQVDLDVRRSFVGDAWVDWRGWSEDEEPSGNARAAYVARQRRIRMAQLDELVKGVLRNRREANYYQGYHDVLSLLLSVLVPLPFPLPDETSPAGTHDAWPNQEAYELTLLAAERVTLHWLRDAMAPTLEPALGWLKTTRNLLRLADAEVARLVERSSPLPYCVLSWQISLFAHDVTDPASFADLVTHILAEGPQAAIYLTVAVLLEAKVRLVYQLGGEAEAWRADPAEIHQAIGNLPVWIDEKRLEVSTIVARAQQLREAFELDPPQARDTSKGASGNDAMLSKGANAEQADRSYRDSVMGKGSVLHSWSKVPPRSSRHQAVHGHGGHLKLATAQDWTRADQSAVDTLREVRTRLDAVVLNAAVEETDVWGADDEEQSEEKALRGGRRGSGKDRGAGPSAGLLLLGALGAGVVLVLSASRGDLAQMRGLVCAGAGLRC